MIIVAPYALYFAIVVLVGALIGKAKGRMGAAIFFSLLLGPIGWLIIALGPTIGHRDSFDDLISRPPLAPQSDELAALRKLFDAGVLTAVEYDSKRALLAARQPTGALLAPPSKPITIHGLND